MTQINELVQKLGTYAEQHPYCFDADLTALIPNNLPFDYELLPISPNGEKIVVLHLPKIRQLLVWCPLLQKVINIGAIQPGKNTMFRCHNTMLEYIKRTKKETDNISNLEKLGSGDFDHKWSTSLAGLVATIHKSGPVAQTIFKDLIQRFEGATK